MGTRTVWVNEGDSITIGEARIEIVRVKPGARNRRVFIRIVRPNGDVEEVEIEDDCLTTPEDSL